MQQTMHAQWTPFSKPPIQNRVPFLSRGHVFCSMGYMFECFWSSRCRGNLCFFNRHLFFALFWLHFNIKLRHEYLSLGLSLVFCAPLISNFSSKKLSMDLVPNSIRIFILFSYQFRDVNLDFDPKPSSALCSHSKRLCLSWRDKKNKCTPLRP